LTIGRLCGEEVDAPSQFPEKRNPTKKKGKRGMSLMKKKGSGKRRRRENAGEGKENLSRVGQYSSLGKKEGGREGSRQRGGKDPRRNGWRDVSQSTSRNG